MEMINTIFMRGVSLAPEKNKITEGYRESFNMFVKWCAPSNCGMVALLPYCPHRPGSGAQPLSGFLFWVSGLSQRMHCSTLIIISN